MIRIVRNIFFFILAATSVLFLKGGEDHSVLKGNSFFPLIDQKGNFLVIYKNPQEGISLATTPMPVQKYHIQDILFSPGLQSPVMKKSRNGEIAVIWVQSSLEKSAIFFGWMRENKIVSVKRVVQSQDFLFSPDFSFDYDNNPWLVWIQYGSKKYYVVVKNLNFNQTWQVNSFPFSSAHHPRLLVGGDNLVWIFWAGQNKARDEILYSIFNSQRWSRPAPLNQKNSVPHITPDAALDQNGFPWVVWSAYDGHDYEIFYSSWSGNRWSGEERITTNEEADYSPAISFISGAIPFVVWSKSDGVRSALCCRYQFDSAWSQEIEFLSSTDRLNRFPKLAVEGDQIAIVWESGQDIASKFFSLSQLLEKSPGLFKGQEAKEWSFPVLDENKYIGFGDSITYGGMDYQETPEKGYIPRLEALLNQQFGYSLVINEGIGGETTPDGLGRMDSVIAAHLARYLLLMEGTNDVIFLEISMDTTAFNLEEMVRKCLDFGVFPLLATIIPRKDWRWFQALYQNRIFDLNDKIRQLADGLKVPLVDQFRVFYYYPEEDGGWSSLLSSDLVHPSEKGYQVMAETWFEEIKTIPFPPVNVHVQRTQDQILFYGRACNVLTWQLNPKIERREYILAYKIYRQVRNGGTLAFELLTTFPRILNKNGQRYIDTKIVPLYNYAYVISALRRDGLEGPPSEVVND